MVLQATLGSPSISVTGTRSSVRTVPKARVATAAGTVKTLSPASFVSPKRTPVPVAVISASRYARANDRSERPAAPASVRAYIAARSPRCHAAAKRSAVCCEDGT